MSATKKFSMEGYTEFYRKKGLSTLLSQKTIVYRGWVECETASIEMNETMRLRGMATDIICQTINTTICDVQMCYA